eukprot:11967-Heterococcus_DN1.PRE.1
MYSQQLRWRHKRACDAPLLQLADHCMLVVTAAAICCCADCAHSGHLCAVVVRSNKVQQEVSIMCIIEV